jgi:hypothetical protein
MLSVVMLNVVAPRDVWETDKVRSKLVRLSEPVTLTKTLAYYVT